MPKHAQPLARIEVASGEYFFFSYLSFLFNLKIGRVAFKMMQRHLGAALLFRRRVG
jgi:hypothetical protein